MEVYPGRRAPACPSIRPPAPEPQAASLGPIALLRVLKKSPIECWAREHFEAPVVTASRAIFAAFPSLIPVGTLAIDTTDACRSEVAPA
jgi:hypothetical protein